MSGYEIIGKEEIKNISDIFKKSNGVLFAHGFEERRNNIFRVKEFEIAFAKKFKSKYAVACSSGTAAGVLCLKAAGIKPGDEVITQAFTFIAVIESILEVGAIPKIVDVDNSLNMCPQDLKRNISKKTKCIIPVHMLGVPCNMSSILSIAKKYKIPVIEDACEAAGVKYNNKYLGTIGYSGFFSLDFGKIITTGEGGMILTQNKKQYLLLKALRDHGHINKKGVHRGQDKALVRGFNYRMTEMQAAVGLAQIKKLEYILKKKKYNKKIFVNQIKKNIPNLGGLGIKIRYSHINAGDQNDHLIFFLRNRKIAKNVKKQLDSINIKTGILPLAARWHYAGYWNHIWRESTKFRFYNRIDFWKNAWYLVTRSISFPISILENKKQIVKKANLISKVFSDFN